MKCYITDNSKQIIKINRFRHIERELSFKVVSGKAAFQELSSYWNRLLENSCQSSIFLTYEWISNYLKIYDNYENLWIIVARNDQEIIGICPFKIVKQNYGFWINAREIRFICESHTDYQDIIVLEQHKEMFFSALINFLIEHSNKWDVLKLSNIKDGSNTIKDFIEAIKANTFEYKILSLDRCLYLNLASEEDKQYANKLISQTKDTKRRLKKLEKLGEVKFVRYKDRDSILAKIDDFFLLHKKRWEKEGAVTKYEDPNNVAFILELLKSFNEEDFCAELVTLELNDKMVAAHLHFNRSGRYYHYNCTFDPDYENYSPGKILNWYLVRDLIDDLNVKVLDFLRGEEEYKRYWANTYKINKQLIIHNSKKSYFSFARKGRLFLSKIKNNINFSRESFHIFERETSNKIPDCQLKAELGLITKVASNEDVSRLLYKFWSDYREARFDNYLRKNYKCIIAEDDDHNILGYGWIAYGDIFIREINKWICLDENECALIDFYVDPYARKRGIYKKLLEGAFIYNRETNIKRSLLYALGSNQAVLRTWNYFGCKQVIVYHYISIYGKSIITKTKSLRDHRILFKSLKSKCIRMIW